MTQVFPQIIMLLKRNELFELWYKTLLYTLDSNNIPKKHTD